MDIDVEHEGKRTKVTPTPPASSGPPSARSESGSIGLLSRGSGPGSQATEDSISEGTKVNQYPSSSVMPDSRGVAIIFRRGTEILKKKSPLDRFYFLSLLIDKKM